MFVSVLPHHPQATSCHDSRKEEATGSALLNRGGASQYFCKYGVNTVFIYYIFSINVHSIKDSCLLTPPWRSALVLEPEFQQYLCFNWHLSFQLWAVLPQRRAVIPALGLPLRAERSLPKAGGFLCQRQVENMPVGCCSDGKRGRNSF